MSSCRKGALTFVDGVGDFVKGTAIALLGDNMGGGEGGHRREESRLRWWCVWGGTEGGVVVVKSRGERMALLNMSGTGVYRMKSHARSRV